MVYYGAAQYFRFPSLLSASITISSQERGARDTVAEAVMFATFACGLLCVNCADNSALNACTLIPASLSPYVITVGATAIKLSSKPMPSFKPPHSVGAEDSIWNQDWDSMKTPLALDEYVVQDVVTWWSNWGPCVDIYGPGDQTWNAFVSAMNDPMGREWGSTMVAKLLGTSYATPRTAAVGALIMQAQLEMVAVVYHGKYAELDACSGFLTSGDLTPAYVQKKHVWARTACLWVRLRQDREHTA
jgi:subtilisin family serine protease